MFTLNVPLTATDLEAIKADLGREFPTVKSSHRCEAMARGLGFRTYAALLEALRANQQVTAVANGAAFRCYLTQHDFSVPAAPFYRVMARTAIRAVLDRTPRLTRDGIGIGPMKGRETVREFNARFVESQRELLSNEGAEEFLRSLVLLGRVKPTKTVRRGMTSYGLKHIAEKYRCTFPEGDQLGPEYVANGSLIAAAIHAGFRYRTSVDHLGYDNLTVTFNMLQSALHDLDCEIRPNGTRAEERRRREERRNRPLAHTYL